MTLLRPSQQRASYRPGDIVSVARRYSNWTDYQDAVVAKLTTPQNPHPSRPSSTPYSIEDPGDVEALFMWQPDGQGYQTDCQISYYLLDKTRVRGLWISYEARISTPRYKGVEPPDKTLPGEYDEEKGTRRAVFKDTHTLVVEEYEGYIINPPYPRFTKRKLHRQATPVWRVLATSLAVGAAVGAAVWALSRRQHH